MSPPPLVEVVKILLMTHLGINLEEEAIATTTIGARVRLMWLTNYITNMRN